MPIPIKPVHSLDLHAELFDGPSMEGLGLSDIQIQMLGISNTPKKEASVKLSNKYITMLKAIDQNINEIVTAAKKAGAHGFISQIVGDYDSEVGKAGARLSAGEKQLISFARAILADPAILVMDEATSSVDTVTEQEIQRGLSELLQGRISLVIAHRLSTIRQADRILVLEHGEIIESGDHATLMAQRGRYYFLYSHFF